MSDIKALAFYLPQFHPIPENDSWWGKGFTEWTNVGKAKPLYKSHKQPRIPADLGYYDLRLPEVRQKQAEIATKFGVHGFIYYHYWFGNGFQLLERVANEILESKKPDFPFCFCWANETWTGRWHGLKNKILAKQSYPNDEDLNKHFEYLLPFFKDDRYIKLDGKPVFMIYKYEDLLENDKFYMEKFQTLAKSSGLQGISFMASNVNKDNLNYGKLGFESKVSYEINRVKYKFRDQEQKKRNKALFKLIKKEKPYVLDAVKMFKEVTYNAQSDVPIFPMVLPNWDNTPRSGYQGEVFENTSPELFKKELKKAVKYLNETNYKEKFLIIKSWNEWAEGNYLEPDLEYGNRYLEVIREVLSI